MRSDGWRVKRVLENLLCMHTALIKLNIFAVSHVENQKIRLDTKNCPVGVSSVTRRFSSSPFKPKHSPGNKTSEENQNQTIAHRPANAVNPTNAKKTRRNKNRFSVTVKKATLIKEAQTQTSTEGQKKLQAQKSQPTRIHVRKYLR